MNKLKKKICTVDELSNEEFIRKWWDDWKDEIIVFKHNKKIFVKSGICPHFGGPVELHKTEKYLICNWHGLKFSIEDNKCLNQDSFKACLDTYDYEIIENNIYIIKK